MLKIGDKTKLFGQEVEIIDIKDRTVVVDKFIEEPLLSKVKRKTNKFDISSFRDIYSKNPE